jgi:hypothetical protein
MENIQGGASNHGQKCNFLKFPLLIGWLKIICVFKKPISKKHFSQCCGAASFLFGSGSGKNLDAAPAAPASTLLYSKAKIFKRTKVEN